MSRKTITKALVLLTCAAWVELGFLIYKNAELKQRKTNFTQLEERLSDQSKIVDLHEKKLQDLEEQLKKQQSEIESRLDNLEED